MATTKITYNGSEISSADETAPVAVTYGGSTIVSVAEGETKTLGCNGKYMSTNVAVGSKTLNCAGKIMASDVVVEVAQESNTVLCFTAEQASSSVTLTQVGTITQSQAFEYSTDKANWSEYTVGTAVTLASAGDKVYFRGNNSTVSEFSSRYFKFTMSGCVNASGDVTSLLNKVGGDATLTAYCFYHLFYGCTALKTAPTLPATSLKRYCYHSMFSGCTSLTTAPALPATRLASSCYGYMFSGCTSLTTAPALPATSLTSSCYYSMFSGCTSLTTAPALPATSLDSDCYGYMFSSCTSLYVSDEQASTASHAWTIPENGTSSIAFSFSNAFRSCLGTRSSDNLVLAAGEQKTYYTQNEPV